MKTNPMVIVGAQLLAGLLVMSLLGGYPTVGKLATLTSAALAAAIWMLRFEPAIMAGWARHPAAARVIRAVCEISREPYPVATMRESVSANVSTTERAGTTEPEMLARLREAAARLRLQMRGCDRQIETIICHLESRCRIRANSGQKMSAPLGVFLLVGASGLGKRSLAAKTGEHLFGRDGVMRIDLGEYEDPLAAIEAAGVGGRAVILENADLANPRLLDFLVRLVGGQTECGDSGGMRFGEQVLFLLVHKDVAGLDEVPAEGGDGPFEEALTRDLGIDKRLHWSSHAVLPFRLPQREECAEVVLQHMSQECVRHGLRLGGVRPQVIAEEVRAVTESGSFEILPSRVFKRMQRAIHSAIGSGAGVVQVE